MGSIKVKLRIFTLCFPKNKKLNKKKNEKTKLELRRDKKKLIQPQGYKTRKNKSAHQHPVSVRHNNNNVQVKGP